MNTFASSFSLSSPLSLAFFLSLSFPRVPHPHSPNTLPCTSSTTMSADAGALPTGSSSMESSLSSFGFPEAQFHQLQITLCVATATLGMYIWDICSHLGEDYQLLKRSKSRPFPTVVYFVARLSSLGFILSHTLSLTARIKNCYALSKSTQFLVVISLSSVTLLFFLRLRAIYSSPSSSSHHHPSSSIFSPITNNSNSIIIILFFLLWLANVACASLTVLLISHTLSVDFGGTLWCLEDGIKIKYASVTAIGALVHDTCVFVAISWRLFRFGESGVTMRVDMPTMSGPGGDQNQNSVLGQSKDDGEHDANHGGSGVNLPVNTVNGLKKTTERYVLGKSLPKFSRALFMDGQMLYLITLIASLSTTLLLYIPSIPTAYRLIADVPQVAILSALACAVFRDARLGRILERSSYGYQAGPLGHAHGMDTRAYYNVHDAFGTGASWSFHQGYRHGRGHNHDSGVNNMTLSTEMYTYASRGVELSTTNESMLDCDVEDGSECVHGHVHRHGLGYCAQDSEMVGIAK
ncbi:hypothetical protein D9758_005010 [Tetrapyrgos nigripes]|uniref:Uncharacterized protein n=1 Tax=Tetrapyrgos nigripes TaxID=182062 RepID=A0A8H5GW35_9AGAR|nr:hypothetical protein D9758_005010 [Tetrapyrgos nigripes]